MFTPAPRRLPGPTLTRCANDWKNRVRIIVEAFRPQVGGGFRSATAAELQPQIDAYDGYPLYLFDGPHYVTPELIEALNN